MKAISKPEDIISLDDMLFELHQLNVLLKSVQIAFAEGPGLDKKDVSDALYYIHNRQNEVHKRIMELYYEG